MREAVEKGDQGAGAGRGALKAKASGGTRTSAVERWLNHASLFLVGLSGIAFGIMKYLLEPDPDSFSVVNHPWQPAALDLHVLSSPLLVFAIGMLARDHVFARWRNRDYVKSRRSGLVLALGVLPMVLSGYLLQTVTGETSLKILLGVHLVSGAVFLLGYLAHASLAQRARRRRSRSEGTESRVAALP